MPDPSRRPRRAVLGTLAVVLAAGAGAGAVALADHGQDKDTPPAAPQVATTEVIRTDLANTQTFAGTLGFGTVAPLKGSGAGTVTKLPAVGAVAERGTPLYWVDGRPVPAFFGDTPLFRPLDTEGIEGPDVAVLADNLAELGYPVGKRASDPTKAKLNATTLASLKKWQDKAGLDPTGTLAVGQVAVLAGPVRVNSVSAQLGDPAEGELLTVTSTTKVITMPVQPGEVGQLAAGVVVTVTRPDGTEIPAKVTAVSTTVEGSQDNEQTTGPPQVAVTITPDDQHTVADLDAASVQISVTTEVHKGVLAVPVGALVALREGGYAVQLPDGTLKAVTTGMFARDLVEVSGEGITENLTVVTTS